MRETHAFPMFKLADAEGDGLNPTLSQAGVFLGDGSPMVKLNRLGHFEVRPYHDLAPLWRRLYGPEFDGQRRMQGLALVARCLNAGEIGKAQIALLHCEFPALEDLASWEKYSPSEPRDARGRWTTGGATSAATPTPTPTPKSTAHRRRMSRPQAAAEGAPDIIVRGRKAPLGNGKGLGGMAPPEPGHIEVPEKYKEMADILRQHGFDVDKMVHGAWVAGRQVEDYASWAHEMQGFINDVKTNGPWDIKNTYKQQLLNVENKQNIEKFGNWLFGLKARAEGFSALDAIQGAGVFQVFFQNRGKDNFWESLENLNQSLSMQRFKEMKSSYLPDYSEDGISIPKPWSDGAEVRANFTQDDLAHYLVNSLIEDKNKKRHYLFGDNEGDSESILEGYDAYRSR